MHRDQLARRIASAPALALQRLSHNSYEWDCSGDCLRRVTREFFARKDRGQSKWNGWNPGEPGALRLIQHFRCKKCEECRKVHRNIWAARAFGECERAIRTWFGTLTVDPQLCQDALNRIRASHARHGDDYDAFPEERRFALLANELGKLVTKALKRLRKSGVPFRYLLVAEAHKSGVPHWHVLVHETLITRPFVKNEHLVPQFERIGFARFKLVDEGNGAVWYVTKYIAKAVPTRVRASIGYGHGCNAAKTLYEHRDDFNLVDECREGGSGGVENPPGSQPVETTPHAPPKRRKGRVELKPDR